MKIRFFILTAVFALFFIACDTNMKWENENDPNADIYEKCTDGSHTCYGQHVSLVCEKGKWKHHEDCPGNKFCNEESGLCEAKEDSNGDSGLEEVSYDDYRVVVKLGWKQGFKSQTDAQLSEGVSVDLDLHLVKKSSLEAPVYGFSRLDGLLGTSRGSADNSCDSLDPECERFWRHDDCSTYDDGKFPGETVAWGASFVYDNTWGGGGNYRFPETIVMGASDGSVDIADDQYLVVVNYSGCLSKYQDSIDRCDGNYPGDDGAYEVDARLEIVVDGEEVPRKATDSRPADHYYGSSKDFKIRQNEWKVVAVINWNNSLDGSESNPEVRGNAVVSDIVMPEQGIKIDPVHYPVCVYFRSADLLVPVWDKDAYVQFVSELKDDYYNMVAGKCYSPEDPSDVAPGDLKIAECDNLPANAEWNIVSEIIQEWDGEKWIPSNESSFSERQSSTECHFKCIEHYSWDEEKSSCVADQIHVTCKELPDYAVWNTVSEITQTWDKATSSWQPSSTGKYNEEPSVDECRFVCDEHHKWNGSSCHPGTQSVQCVGLPANAEWYDGDTIQQTWDDEAEEWLPYNESIYYNDVDENVKCRFICKDGYVWRENACVEVKECSETSGLPCKDSANRLVWSEQLPEMAWGEARSYCDEMDYEYIWWAWGDWHLPTISELRTLIKDCAGTVMPKGTCGVRDDSVKCLSEEETCWDENCISCSGSFEENHSKLGIGGWFWSSSKVSGKSDSAWGVGFNGGDVDNNPKTETHTFLCVRSFCNDNSIWNGSECVSLYACSETSETPCKDFSTGYIWSAKALNNMSLSEAESYCSNYSENGLGGWHLPTIDELRTLIQQCSGSQSGGACAVSDPDHLSNGDLSDACSCALQENNNGYYSKLGDDDTVSLCSSSSVAGDSGSFWGVAFDRGAVDHFSICGDVRCVR